MPELPDLTYIVDKLNPGLCGRTIAQVEVGEPIVIRMLVPSSFPEAMNGQRFEGLERWGPFLRFRLTDVELVVHAMLAGRYHLSEQASKKVKKACFSLLLDDGSVFQYADSKKMGKAYVSRQGEYNDIPGFCRQGIDITGPEFTMAEFRKRIEGTRKQVRVFLMDQSQLSAIGNAYADEILFEARIHPKTFCHQLDCDAVNGLYAGINRVIQWGIDEVSKAAKPVHVKVRDHMRVRGRKGSACPVCGSTIRREQVYGYDTFYCPQCQPPTRKHFISWQ